MKRSGVSSANATSGPNQLSKKTGRSSKSWLTGCLKKKFWRPKKLKCSSAFNRSLPQSDGLPQRPRRSLKLMIEDTGSMKIWRFKSVSWVCDQTRVMGIINLSQDSFSEPQKSGSGLRVRNVIDRACQCLTEGADILDLGAESTRPGADPVPFEVERDRLLPILRLLRKETKIPISIDTTK